MIERMATRINMLKLLQEVRGFAKFTHAADEARPAGPLLLPFRGATARRTAARRRRAIKIAMLEPPDIPHPVPINYIETP